MKNGMHLIPSPSQLQWRDRIAQFMAEHVYPLNERYHYEVNEGARWKVIPTVAAVREKARTAGLWNLFMPPGRFPHVNPDFKFDGPGLSNLEFAFAAEEMGHAHWAAEVFNCSAPDTGNMELLYRFGTAEQQQKWLKPLMNAETRSVFLMTEPAVASSDATNIETSIVRDRDDYVINGRKWWSSGAGDPRCTIGVLMGKTNPQAPTHLQQSMIIVPIDTPGVNIKRMLSVYGFDDAPHGHAEVELKDVRVPVSNILLGEGRGFEMAQARLGPGRIHHCMRSIGVAEAALAAMMRRMHERVAFGATIASQSIWEQRVAEARIDIEMTRLLCLKAADMMDHVGNKAARMEIAMIKVAAPNMATKVLDLAVQAFGGAGVCQDFELAHQWALQRTFRIADGPDEVHKRAIGKMEMKKHQTKQP
jgi:acyl-CoA dehydrogenase